LAPPPKLKVSEWAAEYREMSGKTGPIQGRYDPGFTPFAIEPMNCYNDPIVEQVTLKFCTQVCKTEIHLNLIGYIIDQDPRSLGYALPTEDEVKLFCRTRAKAMLEESPALARHIPAEKHRISNELWNLDEMLLYWLWPTGGKFSGKPFPVFLFDEINKYNVMLSTTEGDPLKIGSDRTINFWNRFLLYSSSPTIPSAPISQKYNESDQSKWHVPCPRCKGYQVLMFREEIDKAELEHRRQAGLEIPDPDEQGRYHVHRVRWPEGAKADDLLRGGDRVVRVQALRGTDRQPREARDERARVVGSQRVLDLGEPGGGDAGDSDAPGVSDEHAGQSLPEPDIL
jgi:phage terminase large subunit GpA-like protein